MRQKLNAKEAEKYFLNAQLPTDESYKLSFAMDSLLGDMPGNIEVVYIADESPSQKETIKIGETEITNYIIKIGDDYRQIQTLTMEERSVTAYKKISDIEAKMLIDSGAYGELFSIEQIFRLTKILLLYTAYNSKIYGSDLGGIKYSGKKQNENIEVSAKTIGVAMDSGYMPMEIGAAIKLNKDKNLTSVKLTQKYYEPYIPSNINISNEESCLLDIVIDYDNVSIDTPDLTNAQDETIYKEVYINSEYGTFPNDFNKYAKPGDKIVLPNPIQNNAEFEGWYYDPDFKYP